MALVALSGCTLFTKLQLHAGLEEADEAFAAGDYALAATRYESLSDRYPNSGQRQLLVIHQGISLYTLGGYHEARDVFLAYLKQYAHGLYVKDAQTYLTKIDALMAIDSPARREAIEAARKDLNQLQQLHLAHPHDPAVTYAIGNLYYEMGNYDEAIRYYYEALTLDAAYKEKSLIKQRVMLDANGQLRPITPDQIRLMEREDRPLVIFDTNHYTARDSDNLGGGPKRFYNLTGLLRNQGSRLLHDVEVEVRFLNAQHAVLDVQVVPVGSMGPDEVRAFRAEASNYDDLYNITDFEITPRWGR